MKRIGDAAYLMGIHSETLRRMAKRGDFPYYRKPSGQYLFYEVDINRFKKKYPTIKKGIRHYLGREE